MCLKKIVYNWIINIKIIQNRKNMEFRIIYYFVHILHISLVKVPSGSTIHFINSSGCTKFYCFSKILNLMKNLCLLRVTFTLVLFSYIILFIEEIWYRLIKWFTRVDSRSLNVFPPKVTCLGHLTIY